MNNDKNIECTIENIRIIEEQINFFENKRILFWLKKKNKNYINRIERLEMIRNYLYRRLEEKMDNE